MKISSKIHFPIENIPPSRIDGMYRRIGLIGTFRNRYVECGYHMAAPNMISINEHEKYWIKVLRSANKVVLQSPFEIMISVEWEKGDECYKYTPCNALNDLVNLYHGDIVLWFVPILDNWVYKD